MDAKSYPDSIALVMKDFILNGTDPNASLAGITVTGGRLNLYNSLLQLLSYDCGSGDCFAPFSIGSANVLDTSATVSWNATSASDTFNIRYREVGTPAWMTFSTTDMSIDLSGLIACTDYELQIESLCE